MDRTKQNYTVSPQNSEPKKICNNMLAYFTKLFRNYMSLKTMLTSAVKRRELIDFTFFPKVHIRVTYFYTPLLGINAIISNCV